MSIQPVYVVKRPSIVQFNVMNFAQFLPFSLTATQDGQTVFTLPLEPTNGVWLYINGTAQNGAKTPPDFVVSGVNLTLSEGVDSGDKVYGLIQY